MKSWNRRLQDYQNFVYTKRWMKGFIVTISLLVFLFLLNGALGRFWEDNTTWRAGLFWTVSCLGAIWLSWRLIWPIGQRFSVWGRKHELDAAKQLGQEIPEVGDEAVNLVELSKGTSALEAAAVAWREKRLEDVDWNKVYRLGFLKKPLIGVAIGAFMLILIAFLGKLDWFVKGNKNVLAYNQEVWEINGFSVLMPSIFEVEELKEWQLEVKTTGNWQPEELWIEWGNEKRPLAKSSHREYVVTMPAKKDSWSFKLRWSEREAIERTVSIIKIPKVVSAKVLLSYPAYLNKNSELVKLEPRLLVPRGTKLEVVLQTIETEGLKTETNGQVVSSWEAVGNGRWKWTMNALSASSNYFRLKNSKGLWKDWFVLEVGTIDDLSPGIKVQFSENGDSLFADVRVWDDYALRSLRTLVKSDKESEVNSLRLNGKEDMRRFVFSKSALQSVYSDLKYLVFEVEDNQGSMAFGKCRSEAYYFKWLSKEEQKATLRELAGTVKADNEALEKEKERRVEEVKAQSLKSKSSTDWNEKNKVESRIEELKELAEEREKRLNILEQISNQLKPKEQDRNWEEWQNRLEELKKENSIAKEKSLDDLLKEKKREELLKKLLENEIKATDLAADEENVLELLKQLELESRFEEALKTAEALVEKQEILAKQRENDVQKQEALDEELKELNKAYEEMLEDNKDLKEPFDMDDLKEEREGAKEKMKQAIEGSKKESSREAQMKKQKESADQLKKLMQAMQSTANDMSVEKHMENMETLRRIQKNLLSLSNGEESVSERLLRISERDPSWRDILQDQKRLLANSGVIKDSLKALAGRAPVISKVVFEAVNRMQIAGQATATELQELNLPRAQSEARYTMTAANDLALLLDEIMNQMQMQLAGMMKGDANCNKPGGGKPSAQGMAKMQKALLGKMESKMKGKGEKGKEDGKEKGKEKGNGSNPGSGEGKAKGSKGIGDKEMAELLRDQEALREAYEKWQEEQGGKGGNGDKTLELMLENEKQLANRRLNGELLERMREIETRLLESEKAELERGEDNERQSNNRLLWMEDKEFENQNKGGFKNEMERLRFNEIKLQPYYLEKAKKIIE